MLGGGPPDAPGEPPWQVQLWAENWRSRLALTALFFALAVPASSVTLQVSTPPLTRPGPWLADSLPLRQRPRPRVPPGAGRLAATGTPPPPVAPGRGLQAASSPAPHTSVWWPALVGTGGGLAVGGVLVAAWWSRPRPRLVPAPWRAAAMWDWMDEDEDEDRPPPPPPRDLPRKPVQIIPGLRRAGQDSRGRALPTRAAAIRADVSRLRDAGGCPQCMVGAPCWVVREKAARFAVVYKKKILSQLEFELQQLLQEGHRPTPQMFCDVLTLYGLTGHAADADSILQELLQDPKQPLDLPLFNCVIHGWARANKPEQALAALEELQQRGLTPAISTLAGSFGWSEGGEVPDKSLLSTVAQFMDPNRAPQVVRDAEAMGMRVHIDLWNAVMRGFCRAKRVTAAKSVIRYLHNEELDMELVARRGMVLRPNAFTYGPLMDLFAEAGNAADAQALLRNMQNQRVAPTTEIFNMLLKCFAKAGNEYGAESVFREMVGGGIWDMSAIGVRPDAFTYATLMELYARQGKLTRLVELFKRMRREEVVPDVVVYSTFVRACSCLRQPEEAERVLRSMEEAGVEPNVVLYTSLITTWCMSERMDEADRTFREMQSKGIVPNKRTFLVLIRGYSRLGRGIPWELIEEMKRLGIPIDSSDLATNA